MARQHMSIPVALMIMIVGGAAVYWAFSSHGWPASDPVVLWRSFPVALRLVVVAGLIANAWGLGGLLDSLIRRGRSEN